MYKMVNREFTEIECRRCSIICRLCLAISMVSIGLFWGITTIQQHPCHINADLVCPNITIPACPKIPDPPKESTCVASLSPPEIAHLEVKTCRPCPCNFDAFYGESCYSVSHNGSLRVSDENRIMFRDSVIKWIDDMRQRTSENITYVQKFHGIVITVSPNFSKLLTNCSNRQVSP